jgi:hypothetical protein
MSLYLCPAIYNSSAVGDANSDSPVISLDGRYVVYRSFADNIVPGSNGGVPNLILYDSLYATNTILSADFYGGGPGNGRSLTPFFSGGNDTVVFESWASDLSTGYSSERSGIFAFQPYTSGVTNAGGSFPIQGFTFSPVSLQTVSGLAPAFSWLTAPGCSYQVLYKDNLNDPVWQILTNNVAVVGGQGYALDLAPSPNQRFYRIVGAP